jgi:hypothetical protein
VLSAVFDVIVTSPFLKKEGGEDGPIFRSSLTSQSSRHSPERR